MTTTPAPGTRAMFEKYNFFRQPDWRWQRVLIMTKKWPLVGRCSKRDDQFVRVARAFAQKWVNRNDEERFQLFEETPGMYFAYQFFLHGQDDTDAINTIQARLLSGQTAEQIADAMGITNDAVQWYEALWFNVTDKLRHRDWVTNQVLLPAWRRPAQEVPIAENGNHLPFRDSTVARPFMDGTLKMFAYFGGPHLVDVMLSGFQSGRPLTSPDDLGPWLDRHVGQTVRRRSAQAAMSFEINKYNVLDLLAVHARLVELDRSEESQNAARSDMDRSIKALIDSLPFTVGDDGRSAFSGSMLGKYDEEAAELRDAEVMIVAAGGDGPQGETEILKALPPPRRTNLATTGLREPDL